MPREMALIGEAAPRRDLGHRHPRPQRPERAREPHLVAPCVRREAGLAREQARGVEGREAHRLREFGKRQRLGQVIGQAGFHCIHTRRVVVHALYQRPLSGMTCEQCGYRVEQRMLRAERIQVGFHGLMRNLHTLREIGVADDVGGKPWHWLDAASHFVDNGLHEIDRQIKHAIPPAQIHRPRAGMHFARIDDRHRARLGHEIRSAIVVLLRARFDHGHGVRVVPVRRKGVVVILGREHFRAGHERRAPIARGIAETGGGHGFTMPWKETASLARTAFSADFE